MEAWAKRKYEEVTAIRDQKDKDIELTRQYLDRVVEKEFFAETFATEMMGDIPPLERADKYLSVWDETDDGGDGACKGACGYNDVYVRDIKDDDLEKLRKLIR